MNSKSKILLIELIVLFAGIPVLLYFYQTPASKLIILASAAVYVLFYVFKIKKIKLVDKFALLNKHLELKNYIIRVSVVSLMILLAGILFRTESVLHIPFNITYIPLVLIGYPVISVIPQEFIYRLYFFERYKTALTNKHTVIFINALLFGFMHIIYRNPIAVIFTFIGGIFLCITYYNTRSLLLVIIEHTLYGYFVFLSGYGQYFMSDNIFRLLLNA